MDRWFFLLEGLERETFSGPHPELAVQWHLGDGQRHVLYDAIGRAIFRCGEHRRYRHEPLDAVGDQLYFLWDHGGLYDLLFLGMGSDFDRVGHFLADPVCIGRFQVFSRSSVVSRIYLQHLCGHVAGALLWAADDILGE